MKKQCYAKKIFYRGTRKSALTENLEKKERIYIEANDEISAIKKA